LKEPLQHRRTRHQKIRLVAVIIWFVLLIPAAIYGFNYYPHAVRYALAVICLVSFPGAIVFWWIIHPFIDFWRRAGMVAAYTTGFGMMILIGVALFFWRDRLLSKDLGNYWYLIVFGLLVYAVSAWMELQCRKLLKLRTLVGVPELKNERSSRQLISKGMYQLVRHPRYLTIIVGMIGFSLVINYLEIYILMLLMVPGLYLIAVFEERELLVRFGDAYQQYRASVPRLFPTRDSFENFRRSFSDQSQ
jgi:protein-S-isoprenylcysteine O-methyltransferase Ste14